MDAIWVIEGISAVYIFGHQSSYLPDFPLSLVHYFKLCYYVAVQVKVDSGDKKFAAIL